MAFQNVYHHRKVAETAMKACDICYKPSASVLVTPDNKDFFFICPAHLKDKHFCAPIIDEAAVAARKKKEVDAEIERVKKEYEERQAKKKDKEEKDKKDDSKKDSKKDSKAESSSTPDQKGATDSGASTPKEEEPRIFALQRAVYQQRLDKKRNAEIAKRNLERLSSPNFFPSVPQRAPARPDSGPASRPDEPGTQE